jgi:hypothetical protein
MMISEELKKVGKAMQRFGVPGFFWSFRFESVPAFLRDSFYE